MTELRKVSQFSRGDDLQRQLSQLESNVIDAIADLVINGAVRLKPTALKTSEYRAQLHDMVICGATMNVLLPTASQMNRGRPVAVLRKAGTISVLAPGSQVQGGLTDSLGTTGLRVYYSDGVDWWRAP